MIQLYLLGRTDLRAEDGAIGAELLAQPRPTALLAYLALEAPEVFFRRDKLASLFWPETDQEHARTNLRKLVHFIRKTLGDTVIEGRGDEELRLAERAIWCDAADFDRCIGANRLARAIELYRGPLLPGFIVTGAHGFQDWLDSHRRRLARAAVKAVLLQAEAYASNGERTAAGDLIHVVESVEPDTVDEYQLRKVLVLLEGLGDKAAALRIYDRYKKWLWKEFRTEPSAETRVVIERLRGT